MKLIFTIHAKQRLIERDIKIREVKSVIEFPDYVIKKKNLFESHKKINGKNIKIIYLEKDKYIKIITVILK